MKSLHFALIMNNCWSFSLHYLLVSRLFRKIGDLLLNMGFEIGLKQMKSQSYPTNKQTNMQNKQTNGTKQYPWSCLAVFWPPQVTMLNTQVFNKSFSERWANLQFLFPPFNLKFGMEKTELPFGRCADMANSMPADILKGVHFVIAWLLFKCSRNFTSMWSSDSLRVETSDLTCLTDFFKMSTEILRIYMSCKRCPAPKIPLHDNLVGQLCQK